MTGDLLAASYKVAMTIDHVPEVANNIKLVSCSSPRKTLFDFHNL